MPKSGGVAALDHRLLAVNPPGWELCRDLGVATLGLHNARLNTGISPNKKNRRNSEGEEHRRLRELGGGSLYKRSTPSIEFDLAELSILTVTIHPHYQSLAPAIKLSACRTRATRIFCRNPSVRSVPDLPAPGAVRPLVSQTTCHPYIRAMSLM